MTRAWADLSLLGVTAIWGGTFVMVKDAVTEVGPLTFLAVRFLLATAFLLPVFVTVRRTRPLQREAPRAAVILAGSLIGAFLFAGYLLQTAGLQFTTASKAGFITGLSVVIVPVVTALLLRRLPAGAVVFGVGLATLGLGLLSLESDLSIQPGDLLVLGCALAFAGHILVVGRFAPRHDVLELTLVQIAAAAALNSVGAVALEHWTAEQIARILPAALFTGLLGTVAAFYLQTLAQRFTTPTHTALIFSMEPVFAALFGYWLAGERLDARAILGCAAILAGMLVAQLAPEHDSPVDEPFSQPDLETASYQPGAQDG